MTTHHTLLIEDNPGDARLILEMLKEAGDCEFVMTCADRLAAGVKELREKPDEVVILDLNLPDSQGLETFSRLQAEFPRLPIVILTGLQDSELALKAVSAGAQDYLTKGDISASDLLRVLRYAIERKRAEQALRRSEDRYRSLTLATAQIVWTTKPNGEVVDDLPSWREFTGQIYAEIIGSGWLACLHPEDRERTAEVWANAVRTVGLYETEYRLRRHDGEYRQMAVRGVPVREADGSIREWVGTCTDITKRKQAEGELQRLNRALRTLSACNQSVVRAQDEFELLEGVCRLLVELSGYRFAWVGYPRHDESKSVRPVAFAGAEDGYLGAVKISWADDRWGHGPTGTALRTGHLVVNRNTITDSTISPWRAEALKRGYASSIALPVCAGSQILGVLTLYAAEPEAFDDQEVGLLSELAVDVGFGIDSIRTREDRKRKADELQESDIRYKNFIAHSIEGVWRVELAKPLPIGLSEDESVAWLFQQGYMAECNQALARFWGFSTPEEIIGKRLAETITASQEGPIESFRSMARSGFQSGTVEFRARDVTGNVRDLLTTEVPIVESGMLVRIWGITRDVSELKRAEETVRRAAAEIRDLYDHAPCGYHSLDKDGVIRRMNETELHWLGYTPEEVVGKLNYADILAEKSRQVFAESFPRFKEAGLARDLEFELVRKDGSVFPVLVSATALRDDNGNYVMSRSTIYDMTERKRAQEAVAVERQRMFEVLETLPVMICLLTSDHHVTFANRSFRERFGESQGRRCYAYCFGRPAPCEFCEAYKVLETGQPHHWEVPAPDGSVIDAHDFPFIDVDGSRMILEMDIDITERKRAEESLRRLSAQLLRAHDDERRRIARELHDSLGQELTALDLNLGWMKQSLGSLFPQVSGVITESLEIVKRCTQEIRDFSYLLHPPMLDEYGLASALRWYTEGFARRTRIQVNLEMPENLRRRSLDVETALFRVVQECLTNAHRHSGSPTVSIRVVEEPNRLYLEVADQGRGVRILASGGTVSRPGTGLGGMRERMRELGGTLEVKSDTSGTMVRASLPMEAEKVA